MKPALWKTYLQGETMILTFSADIEASEADSRILAGQIVPFNKVGNTSAGKVMFAEGSFVELDPKNVRLLSEHNAKDVLGKAIEFSVTETGVTGKFKVSKSTKGTDALIMAQEGLISSFSVGASVLDYEIEKGIMKVTAAELIEVSVVANPAFKDAQITDIAANSNEEAASTDEEQMEKENPDVVVEETEAAPAVEASAPTQPIYTRPRVKPLTEGEAFAHAVYAASGREDSRRVLVEAADDTSNNTGFTLSRGLPQFISDTFPAENRPAVAAVGINALPSVGLTYTLPVLDQAPEVDEIAELDPITNVNTESSFLSIDVKKLGGRNIVSFELLDRSDPSFGDIMLTELRRAYAKKTDEFVLAELNAGGTWSGGFSGDWQGLQAFIANQVPVAYKNTGGLIANQLVASADWWAELIGAVDNSDRPVFNAVAPSNASGSVGVSAARGTVFGCDFSVDHNITTAGLIDASAFLLARGAVWYAESPTTQLRTNILSDGSVEVELYGYAAVKAIRPQGIRKFNLT